MTAKQLNIKNRAYYFYNDLINALDFGPIDLKLYKQHEKTLIFIILVMLTKINLKIGE